MKKEIYIVNENDLGIDQAKEIEKEWGEIEKLWEDIKSSNDIGKMRNLLPRMYKLIEQFGFDNRIITFLNYGDKNVDKANRDGVFAIMCRYACDSSDEIIRQYTDPNKDNNGFYIQKRQLEEQFNPDERVEETEVIANAMEAINTILQLISINKEGLQQLGIDSKSKSVMCTIMRRYFQNQLINSRNSGENLLVNITNGMMRVSIPGYSEPFIAPIKETKYSKLDTLINDDPCLFCKKDGTPMNSSFPIKLTKTQKEVMEYLARNANSKELNIVRGRIQYFDAMNNILKPTEKRKITRPTTQLVKGKGKKIDYSEENRKFFEDINEKIGGYIPEKIINHLLERASYSMEKLYKKMYPKIKSALELLDVPENEFEVEALKMFLYMRIAKPIAEINSGAINKGGLEERIDDSALEYGDAMNLFRTLIEQNMDYKSIRKELRRKAFEKQVVTNQPEEDILDGENEELDEISTGENDFERVDSEEGTDGEVALVHENDFQRINQQADIEEAPILNETQESTEKAETMPEDKNSEIGELYEDVQEERFVKTAENIESNEETKNDWATKFKDFIQQLESKKEELQAERIKLKEYERKLRQSEQAKKEKEAAATTYRESTRKVEEAEAMLKKAQEELDRRKEEEKNAFEDLTRISRSLKQMAIDNKNVEQDKKASEERTTELEADIERMEKKLDELFK